MARTVGALLRTSLTAAAVFAAPALAHAQAQQNGQPGQPQQQPVVAPPGAPVEAPPAMTSGTPSRRNRRGDMDGINDPSMRDSLAQLGSGAKVDKRKATAEAKAERKKKGKGKDKNFSPDAQTEDRDENPDQPWETEFMVYSQPIPETPAVIVARGRE